jgi:imidazolonepropionase-like amidohydrolase
VVPTVGYHYRIHAFDLDPRLVEASTNFDFLNPAERAFVLATAKQALEKDGFIVDSRRTYAGLKAKFVQLLTAGVPVGAGTDVGSAAHFHEGAIWWELNAWREFGARPRVALTAATATAARVLRDERAGTLKEGSHADFVLYAGDVEKGPFELGRVRAVAKANALFVRDGAWVGP